MGITGGVDCLGKSLPCLVGSGEQKGALYLSLPIYSYPTLYSKWGDRAVLLFSIFFISFLVRTKIFNEMKKKK
jgi:apolipoprotein N-acyltransferase